MTVACHLSDYAEVEPQIGTLVRLESDSDNAEVEWMTGTYSEPWVVYKCRRGGAYTTWRETIPITSILCPIKLTATSRISSTLKLQLQKAYEQRRKM